MTKLGALSRLDPRTVWPSESSNFTPWVAENMEELGELLGLDLELRHREASVGDFRVDILAHDLGRDRIVIIENQLEPTDHGHLGQLVTYAAGLEAGVVIWISRDFRDEHRRALDWLNENLGSAVEFFGIAVEILKIDDSSPAVNFRLVASPNAWGRDAKTSKGGELSARQLAYREFFQSLMDELREEHHFTNARRAQPTNWYEFRSEFPGVRYSLSFAQNHRVRTDLYIDVGDGQENQRIFEELRKGKAQNEKAFGEELVWEALDQKRACRIACYREGGIEDPEEVVNSIRAWGIERLLKFRTVFGPQLAAIGKGA